MKTTFFLILSTFFVNEKFFSQTTVKDAGGNIYPVVKIGTQFWMGENLRTEVFANGDPIPLVTSSRYWQEISSFAMEDEILDVIYPAMCYYNNTKLKNTALYNWYIVLDPRNVCPNGWHVPGYDEVEELIKFLGVNTASQKLKSKINWNPIGLNTSGFNALPIGIRYGSGEFDDINKVTEFWTDTPGRSHTELSGYTFIINNTNTVELRTVTKNVGSSIRCTKN
jgi:uncharacterized protein (TIGR02145 family)